MTPTDFEFTVPSFWMTVPFYGKTVPFLVHDSVDICFVLIRIHVKSLKKYFYFTQCLVCCDFVSILLLDADALNL